MAAMFGTGKLFVLLFLGSISAVAAVSRDGEAQGSKVLLVAPPAMGHIIPLLRLGETLVKRGHHVGFCTTDIVGVNITRESCRKYGLVFLDAGVDPYTWYA